MRGKSFIQSKTVWFNVLFILVYVANYFGFGDFQPDTKVIQFTELLQTVGNIYLRYITTKPISKLV